jgi:hypothetical protein
MNKIFNMAAWMTIFLGFVTFGLLGFWLLWPYKIIDFKQVPFKVSTPIVKVGGTLVYAVDYCKYIDIEAQTTKTLTDDIVYSLATTTTNKDTGCHQTIVQLDIPETLPPSDYFLTVNYNYNINPIRVITIKETTEWFKVIK